MKFLQIPFKFLHNSMKFLQISWNFFSKRSSSPTANAFISAITVRISANGFRIWASTNGAILIAIYRPIRCRSQNSNASFAAGVIKRRQIWLATCPLYIGIGIQTVNQRLVGPQPNRRPKAWSALRRLGAASSARAAIRYDLEAIGRQIKTSNLDLKTSNYIPYLSCIRDYRWR